MDSILFCSPAEAGAQLGDDGDDVQRSVTKTFPTGPRPSPGNRLEEEARYWPAALYHFAKTAAALPRTNHGRRLPDADVARSP